MRVRFNRRTVSIEGAVYIEKQVCDTDDFDCPLTEERADEYIELGYAFQLEGAPSVEKEAPPPEKEVPVEKEVQDEPPPKKSTRRPRKSS